MGLCFFASVFRLLLLKLFAMPVMKFGASEIIFLLNHQIYSKV